MSPEKSISPEFEKQIKEAIEKQESSTYGCAVSSDVKDKSELFLGEYAITEEENTSKADNKNKSKTEILKLNINPRFDAEKFVTQHAILKDQKNDPNAYSIVGTKCEILTLSDIKDLDKFNKLLSAQADPSSNLLIKVLDRQYNQNLGTWQIFVIYQTLNFKNPDL